MTASDWIAAGALAVAGLSLYFSLRAGTRSEAVDIEQRRQLARQRFVEIELSMERALDSMRILHTRIGSPRLDTRRSDPSRD